MSNSNRSERPGDGSRQRARAVDEYVPVGRERRGPASPALRGAVAGGAEHDALVREEAYRKRVRRDADRMLDAESWVPPDDTGHSLTEARRNPPPAVRHVISGLLPEGISILSAQFKAGKTTLGIDLSACLVSGQEFLDYFPASNVSNVGYWNLEVDQPQMYEWINRRAGNSRKTRRSGDRLFVAHLRGRNMNLLLEPVREWAVNWLLANEIDIWVIDPQGRMLTSENDAAEYNIWFRAVEQVVYEAGVRAALIFHHTGHPGAGISADAIPRSRGTSAMQGNTDANLAYRHGGDLGTFPPDSLRYLSGFGRGVDLSELTLDMKEDTGQLYVVDDAPGREVDKMRRGEERMDDRAREAARELAIALRNSGKTELQAGDFDRLIPGTKSEKVATRKVAKELGIVIEREGSGNRKYYSISDG